MPDDIYKRLRDRLELHLDPETVLAYADRVEPRFGHRWLNYHLTGYLIPWIDYEMWEDAGLEDILLTTVRIVSEVAPPFERPLIVLLFKDVDSARILFKRLGSRLRDLGEERLVRCSLVDREDDDRFYFVLTTDPKLIRRQARKHFLEVKEEVDLFEAIFGQSTGRAGGQPIATFHKEYQKYGAVLIGFAAVSKKPFPDDLREWPEHPHFIVREEILFKHLSELSRRDLEYFALLPIIEEGDETA